MRIAVLLEVMPGVLPCGLLAVPAKKYKGKSKVP